MQNVVHDRGNIRLGGVRNGYEFQWRTTFLINDAQKDSRNGIGWYLVFLFLEIDHRETFFISRRYFSCALHVRGFVTGSSPISARNYPSFSKPIGPAKPCPTFSCGQPMTKLPANMSQAASYCTSPRCHRFDWMMTPCAGSTLSRRPGSGLEPIGLCYEPRPAASQR